MTTITLNVGKDTVWEEVAKAASYTGGKMTGDKDAYERIMLTEDDRKSLQRFWEEAAAVANDQLKEMILSASPMAEDYSVELEVSNSYDTQLNGSVQTALEGYFVAAILARWYKFANKGEAQGYAADAGAMMQDALRKLYSRKRPQRPKRN